QNGDFLARNLPQRLAEVDVRAVQVGEVEEAQASVVSVVEQADEFLKAHPRLVGLAIAAGDAGAHGEPGRFDVGLAELDPRRCRRRLSVLGGFVRSGHGAETRGRAGGSGQKTSAMNLVHRHSSYT